MAGPGVRSLPGNIGQSAHADVDMGITRQGRPGRELQADMAKEDTLAGAGGEGPCRPGICSKETACRNLLDVNRYECICPHDGSRPNKDMRCPVRRTGPPRPSPIPNIIPPPGNSHAIASQLTRNNNTMRSIAQLPEPRAQVSSEASLLVIVVGLLAGVLLVGTVTTLIWLKRQTLKSFLGRSGANQKTAPRTLSKSMLVATRYAANPQYSGSGGMPGAELPELPPPPPLCAVPLIARTALRLHQELGEGCFGKVYRGELLESAEGVTGVTNKQVAVKVLKSSASREAEEDFMREVEIMSGFRHANILTLLGIVQRDGHGEPWMVFEFMAHGDLAEVLRANSRQLWRPVPGLSTLGPAALHSVALQVAAGMCYLAAQHFVHRDLACRNCLVGEGLVIKIADFGMSRDVYTCDYYKIGGSRMLPVRWMSPESVMFGRFTLESDVWSYGVVLWEIFSFGRQPYYGHSNEEVVKLIHEGIMLIPPENCPPLICDLMRCCWKTDPRDRIKFPEIYDRLAKTASTSSSSSSARISPPLPLPSNLSFIDTCDLPLPPNEISIGDSAHGMELLDAESYLLPKTVTPAVYLETLPA